MNLDIKITESLETSTNPPLFIDGVRASTYIICSAIYFANDNEYPHQPKNIDKGIVISGRRHHNCFATISSLGIDRKDFEDQTQGFLTNTDLFVDRKKGGEIAYKAGQTKELKTRLFSEDLY